MVRRSRSQMPIAARGLTRPDCFSSVNLWNCPHSLLLALSTFCWLRPSDGQSAPYCLFAPTGIAVPPRTAGFGKWQDWIAPAAGFHRIGGRIIVHRECRKWQHNVGSSAYLVMRRRGVSGVLILAGLCGMKDAMSQQVEAGAPIHRALDQLEACTCPSTCPLLQGCVPAHSTQSWMSLASRGDHTSR